MDEKGEDVEALIDELDGQPVTEDSIKSLLHLDYDWTPDEAEEAVRLCGDLIANGKRFGSKSYYTAREVNAAYITRRSQSSHHDT